MKNDEFVVVVTHRVRAASQEDAVDSALNHPDGSARITVWKVPDSIDEDESVLWRGTLADVDKRKE